MTGIVDLHIHAVPRVDDGAKDVQTSLAMLRMAYDQGARHIFCTSHNGYSREDADRYSLGFRMLGSMAKSMFPDLKLYRGTEVLCAGEYIDDIIYGLKNGIFLPLGNSNCVLTELYPDVTPDEAEKIVKSLEDAGYLPILAHAERYPGLYDGKIMPGLAETSCRVQINAYSLTSDAGEDEKTYARRLLSEGYVSFIGSDSHDVLYRPPMLSEGIGYIREHADAVYAEAILYGNAKKLGIIDCERI